ncbi:deoxyribodipyrimidine photo-lyase [Nocardioides sp. zg-579]|uniref:Deoxyribodipyrimidine photo-lyase n=2 Tax=Nocardioides marmotae TaxID=2663857 RepID=A0A6I3J7C2_9ACTN|nr:deoxyribodipyrimidine photo-lyase [Gordonia jinghuaiqii]MTB93849.1 deoxyribodipyrimidine photo-lyase [Nocardioides marmotae]QKE03318.1 deoxyribodipyrimidine photo-lyase [Nocardioides marmotae]
MWFRRDLRLRDNPALLEACADGAVLPLFVLDPRLWGPAGPTRRAYLAASLRSLDAALRGLGAPGLQVGEGDPVRRVPLAARAAGAERVHVAADFGPYGRERDAAVEQALAADGVELVRTGSPYAVPPGTVTSGSGDHYRVFTPFHRVWAQQDRPAPQDAPAHADWLALDEGTVGLPEVDPPDGLELPAAGEDATAERWRAFLDQGIDDYDEQRDLPGTDGTSRMSVHLKWGEVHPRQLLGDLARRRSTGAATYRKELAWREFYADVLWRQPRTAREYYKTQYARLDYDEPGALFEAWQEGRTGFPVVDAGMRQLRSVGWMHNRVRMITASFLVKDLHVEWQHGARHFLHWLSDGDLASNNHGWQWVAGSGTDPSPFFRVFNPTGQGRRFDPEGAYVRRWVAELADPERVPDPHEPSGEVRAAVGYPEPIVDHAAERREALARWERIR